MPTPMIRCGAPHAHNDPGGSHTMSDRDPYPNIEIRTSQIMKWTATATLTVLMILGLVLFFVQIRGILLWVLIGVILAVALEPAVAWLERHRWNRIVAALLVSFVTVAALVAIIVVVALPVVLQADEFIVDLPRLVRSVFSSGGPLNTLEVRFHVLERLQDVTPGQVGDLLLGNQDTVVAAVTRAASVIAATITILTIMVMMLIEGPRAWRSILATLTDEERPWAERIGENFLRAVGGYVRGNLAISLVAGVATYIVLKILGVPYAETLAVLVAVLDIIPLVGATIGAIVVTIVGFAIGGTVEGVVLLVYFVIYQQFENNVLQNVVYSKTVSLSPLIVFVAALVGAALAGIVGVLLAIPLTSAGWVLARDLLALRRDRHQNSEGGATEDETEMSDAVRGRQPAERAATETE